MSGNIPSSVSKYPAALVKRDLGPHQRKRLSDILKKAARQKLSIPQERLKIMLLDKYDVFERDKLVDLTLEQALDDNNKELKDCFENCGSSLTSKFDSVVQHHKSRADGLHGKSASLFERLYKKCQSETGELFEKCRITLKKQDAKIEERDALNKKLKNAMSEEIQKKDNEVEELKEAFEAAKKINGRRTLRTCMISATAGFAAGFTVTNALIRNLFAITSCDDIQSILIPDSDVFDNSDTSCETLAEEFIRSYQLGLEDNHYELMLGLAGIFAASPVAYQLWRVVKGNCKRTNTNNDEAANDNNSGATNGDNTGATNGDNTGATNDNNDDNTSLQDRMKRLEDDVFASDLRNNCSPLQNNISTKLCSFLEDDTQEIYKESVGSLEYVRSIKKSADNDYSKLQSSWSSIINKTAARKTLLESCHLIKDVSLVTDIGETNNPKGVRIIIRFSLLARLVSDFITNNKNLVEDENNIKNINTNIIRVAEMLIDKDMRKEKFREGYSLTKENLENPDAVFAHLFQRAIDTGVIAEPNNLFPKAYLMYQAVQRYANSHLNSQPKI